VSRQRLLHVALFPPTGGDTGGQVRVRATYELLRRTWEIEGVYLDPDPSRADPSRADALPNITLIPNPTASRFLSGTSRSFDRLLRLGQWLSLEAGLPTSAFFRPCSPELRRAVNGAASTADVVLVEFGHLAPCHPPTKPSVLVVHDLWWQKTDLQAEFRRSRGSPGRGLEARRLKAEARQVKRLEVAAYGEYAAVVAVSERNRSALLEAWREEPGDKPHPPVFVAPNGVDAGWFASVPVGGSAEGIAAFVGGMTHPPNRDAVNLLSSSIVPRMGPELRKLLLAGARSERIQAPRIVGLGRVGDIREVYGQANITLAPIRWGSGTRIKIIESLACARPVVAFPEAAEGLDELVECGAVLIAQDDEEFARLAEGLLRDPARARELGALGKTTAEEFDWPKVLDGLERALEYARGRAAGER
jgi:polysaccharide biosynthesis protein PslH